ncbi:MAG: Asp23/Gls24 family envelope stress response protein [Simkaniaceae bacterium]
MQDQFKELDTKELDLPDTVYARDIDNSVFHAITAKCLAMIEGVAFLEGNLLDSLLGREEGGRVKGIHIDQDQKNHSVNVKVEVNVAYGLSIPEKALEIQSKLTTEISKLTGLHVGCVHVVFKNLIPEIDEMDQMEEEEEVLVLEEELPEDL